MLKHNDDTFMTITNHDIYIKLETIEAKMNTKLEGISRRQDFTNGKVKKSLWIASTAMTLCFVLLGFLFQHVGGS